MLYKSQLWTSLNESIKQIPALQSKLALSGKLQNCFRITVWVFVLVAVLVALAEHYMRLTMYSMYSWPWWCDNVWVWGVIVRSKVNIRLYVALVHLNFTRSNRLCERSANWPETRASSSHSSFWPFPSQITSGGWKKKLTGPGWLYTVLLLPSATTTLWQTLCIMETFAII